MSHPRHTGRLRCGTLAVGLLLAACGTTVPEAERLAASGGGMTSTTLEGTGTGIAGGAASTTASSSVGVGGETIDGTGGSGTGTGGTGGTGGTLDGGGDISIPPKGPGWDEEHVYLGLIMSRDKIETVKTMGIKGADQGDPAANARALEKYINDKGGIFGRKVVFRIDDHKFAQMLSQPTVEAQAACTSFTQDNRVIAVMSYEELIDTPNLRTCLSKAGISFFVQQSFPSDDQRLAEYGGYYIPLIAPNWNRFAPFFVERLAAQSYFDGWDTAQGRAGTAPAKVGIFVSDEPASIRSAALLQSALAKAGRTQSVLYRYGNYSSEATPAVLQFRNAGVTHVIGMDGYLFAFATAAESQGYRPRYGITTMNIPSIAMEVTVPTRQNVGAVGVGVSPGVDSNARGDFTPSSKLCRAAFAASGLRFEDRSSFAEGVAFSACDVVRLIADASVAGGGLSGPALLAGISKVGPTFSPASVWGSGLAFGTMSGAGADLAWNTGCNCYKYVDGVARGF